MVIRTVNVNRMNSPIKRKKTAEWIENYNPTMLFISRETHTEQK